jgi:phosphate-selective porin OprO and OprP
VFAGGKEMTKYLVPLLAASALLFASSGVVASESDKLIEKLIEKQILTQQEADAIKAEAAAEKEANKAKLVGQEFGYEPTAPLPVDEGVGTYVRRLGVETADGSERFRIRGRVQLDAGFQDFSDELVEVARENELADYGVIFRRLRLGALGLMRERFEWQIELDFAENAVEIDNTYMGYLMDHGGIFKLGLFKEPFTLEYDTSSRYITFIERSAAVDAYKVSKEPGMMYQTLKPNYHISLGVFGSGVEFERNITEGFSVAGRGTFAPYLNGDDFVHLGASVNFRRNAKDQAGDFYLPVRLRTREGARVIDARLVGRDDLQGVSDFTRYGLEFAAGRGSWWVQSEYIKVDLNLDPTRVAPDETFNVDASSITQDGWYFYTGYYLTGETKQYRAFGGDFANLRPNNNFNPGQGTWGAFEVAFGYSVADSLEHTRVGRGQKQDRYVLGLNWFLTPEAMFKFNVIYLEGERADLEGDGWMYAARAQYFF